MPVTTLFVSGPPGAGKTTLIEALASSVLADDPPHHVRFVLDETCEGVTVRSDGKVSGSLLRGRWQVPYTADLAFEILPEAIHRIRNRTKYVTMLLEADIDHSLRYAFSYSHRIFVMPGPSRVREVFRTSHEAAAALREVMDDTAAFASEIFGLFSSESMDDQDGIKFAEIPMPGGREERVEISGSQVRRFLNSPLGAEIASRIQLQPDYHSLAESDVVMINAGMGGDDDAIEECVKRLGSLFGRLRQGTGRHRDLFACDPADPKDPRTKKLKSRIGDLLNTSR